LPFVNLDPAAESTTDPLPDTVQKVKFAPVTVSGRSSRREIPPRADCPDRTEVPVKFDSEAPAAMAAKWPSAVLPHNFAQQRKTASVPNCDQMAPPADVAAQLTKVTADTEETASPLDTQIAPPVADLRLEKTQFETVTQEEESMRVETLV
jgi:hypothetical protein